MKAARSCPTVCEKACMLSHQRLWFWPDALVMSCSLVAWSLQSFLHKALMPLHKPKCVGLYHQQLAYCVTQVICNPIDTMLFDIVLVHCLFFCQENAVLLMLCKYDLLAAS